MAGLIFKTNGELLKAFLTIFARYLPQNTGDRKETCRSFQNITHIYRVSQKKVCFRNEQLILTQTIAGPGSPADESKNGQFYVFFLTGRPRRKFLMHTFFWDTLYMKILNHVYSVFTF